MSNVFHEFIVCFCVDLLPFSVDFSLIKFKKLFKMAFISRVVFHCDYMLWQLLPFGDII